MATRKIVTPSNFQMNFSPKTIGEMIALNMMVKQEVLEINRIFPNDNATRDENGYRKLVLTSVKSLTQGHK